jgi:hypothetical protein
MPPRTGLGQVAGAVLQICRADGAENSWRQGFGKAVGSATKKAMSFTLVEIKTAKSDEDLIKILSSELHLRLPKRVHADYDILTGLIRSLPQGLRAMAATHRLDVSMATDDLGWHFFNFCHREFCDETMRGLFELEAIEPAEIFKQAWTLVEPHWERLGQLKKSPKTFADWYESSGLEVSIKPLNRRLWKICSESPDYGLMQFWLTYTRKYPKRLFEKA